MDCLEDRKDADLVVELVGLVLVVDGDGEDGRVGQGQTVRFIHFGVPLGFGELRWHVVDILDADRRRAGACP